MPEDPVLARQVDAFLEASVTGRNGRAWRLLAEHPDIATFDFRTAVVLGDAGRVRELLAGDPALAVRPDDRSGWPPLLGVCSSRWHRIDPSRAAGMLAVARLLLEAGADPNSTAGRPGDRGYCSSLYAAAGCADNPAITELLLHLGAVPDDHTLYLTSFHRDHACLRLLLDHGAPSSGSTALAAPISTGDVEGVRLLLEAGADPNQPLPDDLVAETGTGSERVTPLHAALEAGCPTPLIALLLAHGADPRAPDRTGMSPYRRAVRRDRLDVAEALLAAGAADDADAADLLLGACLRGDRAAARALVDSHPGLPGRLGADDHAAIIEAADRGQSGAVGLMLDLGFPIEARARNDGATVLHAAAAAGAAGLVRMLIERGADIEARDTTWQATPLDWASVGSGLKLGRNPDPDWVSTVTTLLDAGADPQGAWVTEKPPSSEVAALLRARGVIPPTEVDDPAS